MYVWLQIFSLSAFCVVHFVVKSTLSQITYIHSAQEKQSQQYCAVRSFEQEWLQCILHSGTITVNGAHSATSEAVMCRQLVAVDDRFDGTKHIPNNNLADLMDFVVSSSLYLMHCECWAGTKLLLYLMQISWGLNSYRG